MDLPSFSTSSAEHAHEGVKEFYTYQSVPLAETFLSMSTLMCFGKMGHEKLKKRAVWWT